MVEVTAGAGRVPALGAVSLAAATVAAARAEVRWEVAAKEEEVAAGVGGEAAEKAMVEVAAVATGVAGVAAFVGVATAVEAAAAAAAVMGWAVVVATAQVDVATVEVAAQWKEVVQTVAGAGGSAWAVREAVVELAAVAASRVAKAVVEAEAMVQVGLV